MCYCETVKNITVSVPDDVYRSARVAAAQRDTSVSALVVAYLERLSGRMEEFTRVEALQHEVQAEIGQFRAADRLGREEVHDRAVQSGSSIRFAESSALEAVRGRRVWRRVVGVDRRVREPCDRRAANRGAEADHPSGKAAGDLG